MDAHDYTGAFVGDDSQNDGCKLVLTEDGSSYELEHGLEDCGMTLEYVQEPENQYLKFSVSQKLRIRLKSTGQVTR